MSAFQRLNSMQLRMNVRKGYGIMEGSGVSSRILNPIDFNMFETIEDLLDHPDHFDNIQKYA